MPQPLMSQTDRNAHSMTVAVKGVDKLYKAVEREKEAKFLAFSISHDYRSMRIFSYDVIMVEEKDYLLSSSDL